MTRTNLGYLGINAGQIGRAKSSLRRYWLELEKRHQAVVKNPADADSSKKLVAHIESNPAHFKNGLPKHVLSFAICTEKKPRRIRFLRHLLANGYPVPEIRDNVDPSAFDDQVVAALVSDYFYSASLSHLSAARGLPGFSMVLTAPITGKSEWIITEEEAEPRKLMVKFGLTFIDDKFCFVRYSTPLRVHFLYPIDSYYKKDRAQDLVVRAERFKIPMPGSRIVRKVADDKRLYQTVFAGIRGLSFPRQEIITAKGDEILDLNLSAKILGFSGEHRLDSVFIKPYSGFGGSGAAAFDLPGSIDQAARHARELLSHYGGFLIQERLSPIPLANDQEEWNVRQYALSTEKGLESRWKRFRVGQKGSAINTMLGARSLTQRQLMEQIALPAAQRQTFEALLAGTDRIGLEIMNCLHQHNLARHGRQASNYYGGGSTLQPGLISIDLIIRPQPGRPGEFEVDFLEINDHGSGGIRNYDVIHYLERHGEGPVLLEHEEDTLARSIVEMMMWRGSRYKRYIDSLA